MSMEIHALSDRRPASMADWQRAIDAEGFPLRLSVERPLEALKGFVPATSGEEATGFERYHDDPGELMGAYEDVVVFDHAWKHAISFCFGADLNACVAAYMAVAAYAKATDGIVFDPQEGEILTPQHAIDLARGMERDVREASCADV